MIEVKEKTEINHHGVELWASRVLRLGVWISASMMIIGLLCMAVFPSTIRSTDAPSLIALIEQIFSGNFNSTNLLFAGLIVLMFTPILRVFTVLLGYIVERDWLFVAISFIVFLMLTGEIVYSIFIKG